MNKTTAAPVVASTVRAWFQASPERMALLSPEAQHTVRKGAKGLLHKQAIAKFNRGRKAHRRYVVGATTASAKAARSQREVLVAAGLTGKRGPLSREALASLKG